MAKKSDFEFTGFMTNGRLFATKATHQPTGFVVEFGECLDTREALKRAQEAFDSVALSPQQSQGGAER